MTEKIPTQLIVALAGIMFLFLCMAGAGVTLFLRPDDQYDYPHGTVVEGVGRCGTTEWVQRGKSVRLERYRCVVTNDEIGDVIVWYIRQGYTPLNQGMVLGEAKEGVFDVFDLERVYAIDQKDGTVLVRIYDDMTIRAPLP